MAVASVLNNPNVDIPVLPDGTQATLNLLGFTGIIGPRRNEIRQVLNSVGITVNNFPEAIPNTRFNAELITTIDAVLSQTKTFRLEKCDFPCT